MFLWKCVQGHPHWLIAFFLFWICMIKRFQDDWCVSFVLCQVHIMITHHLPLNTFNSCFPCDSGMRPPGSSLRKSFNKEAKGWISSMSNSGKAPLLKLFFSSWYCFTFPLTLKRPLMLRPKQIHILQTQPLSIQKIKWSAVSITHHAGPETAPCVSVLKEGLVSFGHIASGDSEAHQI